MCFRLLGLGHLRVPACLSSEVDLLDDRSDAGRTGGARLSSLVRDELFPIETASDYILHATDHVVRWLAR